MLKKALVSWRKTQHIREKNPQSVRSTRTRKIVNYKQLAGLEGGENDMDGKSEKSVKSKKSRKTAKENVKKTDKLDSDDSRKDDFTEAEEADDDAFSLGSDKVRVIELQQKIDAAEPSMAEQYNNYKVQQGLQDRLEDAELPSDLNEESGRNYMKSRKNSPVTG